MFLILLLPKKKKKYLSDSSRDCYLLRIFLQGCLCMLEELLFFAALHYVFILLSVDVLGDIVTSIFVEKQKF